MKLSLQTLHYDINFFSCIESGSGLSEGTEISKFRKLEIEVIIMFWSILHVAYANCCVAFPSVLANDLEHRVIGAKAYVLAYAL